MRRRPSNNPMRCLPCAQDMQSVDALCDAVEEFEGGVIVISHDAQLLSRICADEERSQVRPRWHVTDCVASWHLHDLGSWRTGRAVPGSLRV